MQYLASINAYILRALAVLLVLNSHSDVFGNPLGVGGQLGNGLFFILAGVYFKTALGSIKKIAFVYLLYNVIALILEIILGLSLYFVDLWFLNALIIFLCLEYFFRLFRLSYFIVYWLIVYAISLRLFGFQDLETEFIHKVVFYSIFFYLGVSRGQRWSSRSYFVLSIFLYIPAGLSLFGILSDLIQQISVIFLAVYFVSLTTSVKLFQNCSPMLLVPIKNFAIHSLEIYFWQVALLHYYGVYQYQFWLYLLLIFVFSWSSRFLSQTLWKWFDI